jgi:hypothetical protein
MLWNPKHDLCPAARLLLKAKEVIADGGWCKEALVLNNMHCMVGALHKAACDLDDPECFREFKTALRLLADECRNHLWKTYPPPWTAVQIIMLTNDNPGTTRTLVFGWLTAAVEAATAANNLLSLHLFDTCFKCQTTCFFEMVISGGPKSNEACRAARAPNERSAQPQQRSGLQQHLSQKTCFKFSGVVCSSI